MATRGWEGVKARDLKGAPSRQKYGSTKTTVDGITFDSKKEAKRYHELKLMQQAGQILALRMQPHYTLCALVVDGADLRDVNTGDIVNRRHPVCEYVADFEYLALTTYSPANGPTWLPIVEDVKSVATRKKEVYRLKRKLFEAQYGVTIREM
jgi:hypothetical protein